MKIVEKTKWLDADRNESFSMDWNTGKILHQVQCTQDVAWHKVVKGTNNEPALFVAFEKKGCAIFNRALQPIDDPRIIHPLVQQLSPVTAVADDLSALLGWSDNNHLTHISLHDMRETQIWCFGDSKYMQSHVGSKSCQYSIYDRPKHVILSTCGRVAAYMLLHDVILIDALTGKVVLQWRTPWGKINGLSFDGSGQWMILVHNDNQIETFHLWWDVT